jgi:type IV pilus assembly protein PilW
MRAPIVSMRRMHGLSLVELMIAMTIGLVTMAAIGWVYQGTIQTFRTHDSLSRMQEGARYAFEILAQDLRMAGAAGCPYGTNVNVVNGNTDWYKNLFGQALASDEENGTANSETEFSDALRVVRADVLREYLVQAHDAAAFVFTLTGVHDIEPGEFLVATDCVHASLFQVSAAAPGTLSHAAGGVPGNSTGNLGAAAAVYAYIPGSRLYRLRGTTYYVDTNAVGQPALFRMRAVGATAVLTPEELVEGVEDLQVTYGVDTTGDGETDFVDPDGDGDPYLTSAQVNSGAVPGATPQDKWARVMSTRISLLMRTTEDRVVPNPQTYAYNGANVVAADRRLRKVFTHVINVRNR